VLISVLMVKVVGAAALGEVRVVLLGVTAVIDRP